MTTDTDGFFTIPEQLPASFQVQASTSLGEVYRSDYRNEPAPVGLNVNPVTDVISAYLALHPEANLLQATDEVKEFLSLPDDFDVRIEVGDGELDPFSVSGYVRAARNSGGLGGGPSSYPFELARRAGTTELPISFEPQGLAVDLIVLAVKGIATGAGEETGETAVGWLLHGRSSPTSSNTSQFAAAQAAAQMQIQQLSNQVTQLTQQVTKFATAQAYLTLANQLTGDINVISTTTAVIANSTTGLPDNSTTAAGLSAMIGDFHDRQVGNAGAAPGMMRLLQAELGFPPAQFISTNLGFSQLVAQYQLYAGWQQQLANCIVELMHASVPPELEGPSSVLETVAANLKAQQALLPIPPPADGVVVDRQNGLVWLDKVFPGSLNYQAAAQAQQAAQTGLAGLSSWRIATADDYQASFKGLDYSSATNLALVQAAFPNMSKYITQGLPPTPSGIGAHALGTTTLSPAGNMIQYGFMPNNGLNSGDVPTNYPTGKSEWDSPWIAFAAFPYMLVSPVNVAIAPSWAPLVGTVTGLEVFSSVSPPTLGNMVTQVSCQGIITSKFGSNVAVMSANVIWSDDSPEVTVSNYAGSEGVVLYSGLSPKPFNVTATYQGTASNNVLLSKTLQINLVGPNTATPTDTIQLEPPGANFSASSPLRVFAQLFKVLNLNNVPPLFNYGLAPQDVTNSVNWTASNPAAVFSSLAGEVILQLPSSAPSQTLTATATLPLGNQPADTATFVWLGPLPGPSPTASPSPSPSPALTGLALSPSDFTLLYDQGQRSQTFTLRGTPGGNLVPNGNAIWQSSDPALASVAAGNLTVNRRPERETTVTVNASISLPQGGTLTSNNARVTIKR